MNMSTDDVYKMLTIVDKNADNLAKLDGDFAQIAGGKLAAFPEARRWSRPGTSSPFTPAWRSS